MLNVAITTSVTEVLPAANRGAQDIVVQNQSDVTLWLAFGANCATLAAGLGLKLEPGDIYVIDRPTSHRRICAIHEDTGDKTLHVQLV